MSYECTSTVYASIDDSFDVVHSTTREGVKITKHSTPETSWKTFSANCEVQLNIRKHELKYCTECHVKEGLPYPSSFTSSVIRERTSIFRRLSLCPPLMIESCAECKVPQQVRASHV